MTAVPELPAAVPSGPEVDAVLAARAMVDAEHIAGLIVAGQLDTAGRPDRLPADLFPDDDPEVVKRVWQRALVVGIRAGQMSLSPRFRRDQLARLQGELQAAGDFAMAGLVGRSRQVADAVPGWHPADEEEGREH